MRDLSKGARAGSWVSVVAVLCLCYACLVSLTWPYTMDDAYISLRYAAHLARGLGLTWNPGGEPVEGYSNFLWVLWMALASKIAPDPMVLTKLLGAALGLGTIVLLGREGRAVVGEDGYGLLPSAFLALSPMFAFWAASGIEMPAFALALLLAWRWMRQGRTLLMGTAWAAAALLRPEGVFLMGAGILVFLGFALRRADRRAARCLALGAAITLLPVAAYTGWRLVHFGTFFPNTVLAKWEPLAGLRYFDGELLRYQGVHVLLALVWVAMCLAGVTGAPRAGKGTAITEGEGSGACEAIVGGMAIAGTQAVLLAQARPTMGFYLRLFWPVLPFLFIASAGALRWLSGRFRSPWLVAVPAAALMMFPIVRDAAPIRLPGARTAAPVLRTAAAVGEILSSVHVPVADWLVQNHPGATVALTDCGVLPYRSDLRILDLWGLNDREISTHGFDPDRVLDRSPEVLVLASRSATRFEPRFGTDAALWSHPAVARDYGLAKVFSWSNDLDDSGDYSLWVYVRGAAGGGAGSGGRGDGP